MNKKTISLRSNVFVPFHNHATDCIGTGRMALALHQEYQAS